MSEPPDDEPDRTEPPQIPATVSEPVTREMVKEIMMEVLSGLKESSSKQSDNDDTTGKEAGKGGKYRLAPFNGDNSCHRGRGHKGLSVLIM